MANVQEEWLPPCHYRISVTSMENPTYAELCKRYDMSKFRNAQSPFELHFSLKKEVVTTGDKVVYFRKLDRQRQNPDAALYWAECNGYRFAFPAEREAFIQANPGIHFWFVDFGSYQREGRSKFYPIINMHQGRPYPFEEIVDHGDSEDCFLGEEPGYYSMCCVLLVRV